MAYDASAAFSVVSRHKSLWRRSSAPAPFHVCAASSARRPHSLTSILSMRAPQCSAAKQCPITMVGRLVDALPSCQPPNPNARPPMARPLPRVMPFSAPAAVWMAALAIWAAMRLVGAAGEGSSSWAASPYTNPHDTYLRRARRADLSSPTTSLRRLACSFSASLSARESRGAARRVTNSDRERSQARARAQKERWERFSRNLARAELVCR